MTLAPGIAVEGTGSAETREQVRTLFEQLPPVPFEQLLVPLRHFSSRYFFFPSMFLVSLSLADELLSLADELIFLADERRVVLDRSMNQSMSFCFSLTENKNYIYCYL